MACGEEAFDAVESLDGVGGRGRDGSARVICFASPEIFEDSIRASLGGELVLDGGWKLIGGSIA